MARLALFLVFGLGLVFPWGLTNLPVQGPSGASWVRLPDHQTSRTNLPDTSAGEARWKSEDVRIGVAADSGIFGQMILGLYRYIGVGGQERDLAVTSTVQGKEQDAEAAASLLQPRAEQGRYAETDAYYLFPHTGMGVVDYVTSWVYNDR